MKLEKITNQNLWDVVNLEVKPDQEKYIADNTISLLEAYATQNEGGKVGDKRVLVLDLEKFIKLVIKGVGIYLILLMLYFVINLFINFDVYQISNLFGIKLVIDVSKGRTVAMSTVSHNFYMNLLSFGLFYGGFAFWREEK